MKLLVLVFVVMTLACNRGPSDSQLQAQVTTAISSAHPNITASVKGKVVTLTGTCHDEACKTSIEASAKNIKGVQRVMNNIVVDAPPPVALQPEITEDNALQTSVNTLLTAYKTVNATVRNGVVTLTGEIKRSQLAPLVQRINELKPKKVENKLVIK